MCSNVDGSSRANKKSRASRTAAVAGPKRGELAALKDESQKDAEGAGVRPAPPGAGSVGCATTRQEQSQGKYQTPTTLADQGIDSSVQAKLTASGQHSATGH